MTLLRTSELFSPDTIHTMSLEVGQDKWAAWVLRRRHGGDSSQRERELEYLIPIRDRVLDNARISPRDVVLDVGSGDGLVAFGALERLGPEGRVIVSDISGDLIRHTEALATELGHADRASFVEASADDLSPMAGETLDVVTTRSVLIYVDDKARAFREFYRVLRQGGRVSIFEPINSYFPETPDDFWGFDARPVRDLVTKILDYEGWTDSAYEDDPMMNFTERDLFKYAEEGGFREIHAELVVDVEPGSWVVDWDRLLNTSPNPNAHTVAEILDRALSEEERTRFERHIRPLADAGLGVKRSAFAFLWAVKG
jgi:arsenite methyltransferase